MDKVDKFQNESASKGNSEDSLLVFLKNIVLTIINCLLKM